MDSLPLDVLKIILYQTDFKTSLHFRLVCKKFYSQFSNLYDLWFKFEHAIDPEILKLIAIQIKYLYWKYKNKIHYVEINHGRFNRSRGKIALTSIYYYDTDHKFPKCLMNHNKIYKFMQFITKNGRILLPFVVSNDHLIPIYECRKSFVGQINKLCLEKKDNKFEFIDIFNYMKPLQFAKLLSPIFSDLFSKIILKSSFPIKIPVRVTLDLDLKTIISVLFQLKLINIKEFVKELNIASLKHF